VSDADREAFRALMRRLRRAHALDVGALVASRTLVRKQARQPRRQHVLSKGADGKIVSRPSSAARWTWVPARQARGLVVFASCCSIRRERVATTPLLAVDPGVARPLACAAARAMINDDERGVGVLARFVSFGALGETGDAAHDAGAARDVKERLAGGEAQSASDEAQSTEGEAQSGAKRRREGGQSTTSVVPQSSVGVEEEQHAWRTSLDTARHDAYTSAARHVGDAHARNQSLVSEARRARARRHRHGQQRIARIGSEMYGACGDVFTELGEAPIAPVVVLGLGSGLRSSFNVRGARTTASALSNANRLASGGVCVVRCECVC
jgi:hypothetical protein